MANKFDEGMDDYYLGKEPKGDPVLEYLRGWSYAESLYEQQPEQTDDRVQEDDREQQRE
jgi:hypothetical protein